MSKVLILGAGMVSKPIVNYLLNKGFFVTIGDFEKDKAIEVISNHPKGKAIFFDATDDKTLNNLVESHNIVVSILPYVFHVKIAKTCIAHKKNMITTSYVKAEMSDLDKEAKEAGVIILNEIGLDPGIDHMSAKKIIDEVHEKNGEIKEFYSFCGALPEPDAIDNPFGYKFSWSPEGVVMASKNPAIYKRNNKIIEVSRLDIFKDLRWIKFPKIGKVEVYPNRDSLAYIDIYNIPESNTAVRGTIRFLGWSEILDSIKKLELLSYEEIDVKNKTYAGFLASRINANSTKRLPEKLAEYLNINITSNIIKAFEYIGYFKNKPIDEKNKSPFDITAGLMIPNMMLQHDERDLILMLHTFLVEYEDGKTEIIKSRMINYGEIGGNTAISKTVGLPAAIAVKMILDNEIKIKGVHIPTIPEIYKPVLKELENLGIKMEEEYGLSELGIIRDTE
ncbi:MAG: saccharopine dehydrogenase C-terminal domain-containing protein [Bacteroidota bacterium]|nr:saccharopine dehydrogenase C-terminal domain-containing protein [Bacteroidota bacterium]